MNRQGIRLAVENQIAIVTLDYPPVNALTTDAYVEITETFEELSDRPDVTVAILTGAGTKAFCAGRDVRDAAAGPPRHRQRLAREAYWSILECEVPVIAAVNGPALGGGAAIVLVCDIVIASEKAVFGFPEMDVGALGGYKFLTRVVPEPRARQMFFTAERIDAAEAFRLGIVGKVVSADELMPEALRMARTVAAKSRTIVRMAKQSMIHSQWHNLKEGYRIEQGYTVALSKTEEAKEAARAFAEKRRPVFEER